MRKRQILVGPVLAVTVIGVGVFAYFTVLVEPPRKMATKPARVALAVNATVAEHDIDYTEIGFALMKNESLGPLRYGLPAVEVTDALGKPDDKSPATIWGADGRPHQDWYYRVQGIELNCIGEGQEQTVFTIKVESPCTYRTKRDIGIGSAREAVQEAYRNEINSGDSRPDSLVVGSIYGGLIFHFAADRVSSIFIGTAAE